MKHLPLFLSTLFLGFLTLLNSGTKAQPIFTPEDTLSISCHFFTVDPIGNLYCATHDGMTKYNAARTEQWHYSNPGYGRIQSIDATDPLNILVFHPDFQQVLWLDRNLAEKPHPESGPVLSQELPKIICSSAQGGFWVFMPQSGRLRRFSQALRPEAQSLPFFEILPSFQSPVFMTESEGKVYVSQPDQGIAVFDAFGNFLSLMPLRGVERFQVMGNQLIWFSEKEMVVFDFVLQEERLFLLPETRIRSGLLMGRKVFIQTDHEIKIFRAAGRLF
ncbi:MAG: hypothetical protein V2I46_10770 [Bacteroides sp.]|nr:hypothetical protein [Bacteroides sp.]